MQQSRLPTRWELQEAEDPELKAALALSMSASDRGQGHSCVNPDRVWWKCNWPNLTVAEMVSEFELLRSALALVPFAIQCWLYPLVSENCISWLNSEVRATSWPKQPRLGAVGGFPPEMLWEWPDLSGSAQASADAEVIRCSGNSDVSGPWARFVAFPHSETFVSLEVL